MKSFQMVCVSVLLCLSIPSITLAHFSYNGKRNSANVKQQRQNKKIIRKIASSGKVVKGPDIQNESSITEFSKQVSSAEDIDCRSLKYIPGTILCLTKTEPQLKALMGRISYFVEGKQGRILVQEDNPTYQISDQANYAGHDIMYSDFSEFYTKIDESCLSPTSSEKICLNTEEIALRKLIDDEKKSFGNVVVIAAQAETDILNVVVSHEILHAKFFLNPEYQKIVKKFWIDKVVAAQKDVEIHNKLSDIYAVANATVSFTEGQGPSSRPELLLLNEFQAYILQQGDRRYSHLKEYMDLFRSELERALKPINSH
jgi:hypothetical protein